MRTPLRVLIVEDDLNDAELVLNELQLGGYEPSYERVVTAAQMAAALSNRRWDLVLSDFALPQFSGAAALALLQKSGLDIPFIVVSGTVDEDQAIDILTAGAHDFLLKGRRARLVPAIQRELREARVRHEHRRAEAAVQASEKRFRALVENSSDGIVLLNADWQATYRSPATARLTGYSDSERLGQPLTDTAHPDDLITLTHQLEAVVATPEAPIRLEYRNRHQDGSWHWVEVVLSNLLTEPSVQSIVVNFRDITDRKQAEADSQRQLERLAALRIVDQAITSSLDLRLTLTVFLAQVMTQLGAQAADVLLYDKVEHNLKFIAGNGFHISGLEGTRLPLSDGRAGRAVVERRTVSEEAPGSAPLACHHTGRLKADKFASYYGVPLIAKGQVVGVLELFYRTPQPPAQDWIEFLEALAAQAAIAIENAALFTGLQRSHQELSLAYDTTIAGWSRALDLRDHETEGHSQRVTELTLRLAERLGVSQEELVHMQRGALLHDIGKMGIPDRILLKAGPLTDDEWVVMRRHPVYAHQFLTPIEYLRPALEIPYAHHEKWDGTGYPRGLKGEQIPLAARIFAVIDVWDAVRSNRPYRPAWPTAQALVHVRAHAGSHFDPQVVRAFVQLVLEAEQYHEPVTVEICPS